MLIIDLNLHWYINLSDVRWFGGLAMNKRCIGLLLLFLLSVDYAIKQSAWATPGGGSGGGGSGIASSSGPQCGAGLAGVGFLFLIIILSLLLFLGVINSPLHRKFSNDDGLYGVGEATVQQSDGSLQKARLHPGSNMIGRNPDSPIFLNDQKVSGKHADLFVSENRYVLTDLNSRNGTKVNGQNISQQDVYQGDEIQIGDSFIWV
jgi:hypothetical protein